MDALTLMKNFSPWQQISIVLAILGLMIASLGGLSQILSVLPPLLDVGLILTISNRLRFSLTASRKSAV